METMSLNTLFINSYNITISIYFHLYFSILNNNWLYTFLTIILPLELSIKKPYYWCFSLFSIIHYLKMNSSEWDTPVETEYFFLW